MIETDLIIPVESKMKKTPFPFSTVTDVMAAAVAVHKKQGFIRSGQGYTDSSNPDVDPIETFDNKTVIMAQYLDTKHKFTQEEYDEANNLIDSINGKLMLKKMTNNLDWVLTNVLLQI